jgi:hypothetical protein
MMTMPTAGLAVQDALPDEGGPAPESITVAGRRLPVSPVFDTYWRFTAERQKVYTSRVAGRPGPWTKDRILLDHRFTNAYRAADRVSQYLIRSVVYTGDHSFQEVFFRTLLFKIFNKIETWQLLLDQIGQPEWRSFDLDQYDHVLSQAFSSGRRLYSAAYVMPAPHFGAPRKHTNHLRLLRHMMLAQLPEAVQHAESMAGAFDLLRAMPGLGDFLAFQYLIDLNYSDGLHFDEMEYVVAGPGAKDGIRKCFGPRAAGIEGEVIRYMADTQDEHFHRLGLKFDRLGRRPLQLIDCQNLFCEVDKYARIAHPNVTSISGRTRIKQKFRQNTAPLETWFPPKWRID